MTTDERLDLILTSIASMNKDLQSVKTDLDSLKTDLQDVKDKTTKSNVTIENIIEPKIQLLYEQQDSLAQKSDLVPIKEDIQEIRSDLDVVKHVVTEHSEKIRKLKNA